MISFKYYIQNSKTARLMAVAALIVSHASLFTSCDDLIDPAIENHKDLSEFGRDYNFAQSFVINAYRNLPAYYDNTDYATDDAVTNDRTNGFLKMATGSWTSANDPTNRWAADYASIQYLNIYLANEDVVNYWKTSDEANQLTKMRVLGEAHALRAIHMYYLLRAHSGFTTDGRLMGILILDEVKQASSDFNQPRATFQQCIDFMLKDLDEAARLLPMEYNNAKSPEDIPAKFRSITTATALYNRAMGNTARQLVNGLIVEAFRSRILQLAASPAFQDASNSITWNDAANAAASVIDYAGGVGGLDPEGGRYYDNSQIASIKEGTNPKEIIWRENLGATSTTEEDNNYPPSLFGNGRMNPTQNLVDAFPMANGYPISDPRSGYDARNPYLGRDPRLSNYVIYNGAAAGTAGTPIYTGSESGTADGLDLTEGRSTRTGYYMKKRLNMRVNSNPTSKTGQLHLTPRLRYTEFFLNYAEAANEAYGPMQDGGHGYSAYDVIKAIRQRAGITEGDAWLEECAADKDKMRQLIRNERRLELCFESFRLWDLRRWNVSMTEAARGIDINGSAIRPITVESRAYQDYMHWGAIPYGEVLKYSNLEQNKGW